MAVWLHDIGHKGNERYGEAYLIRDNHGYISAEYILKYPRLFGIKEEDESEQKNSYYEKIKFKCGNPGSAIEILYRRSRERKKLSNAEKIALISAYHKSNIPLTEEDYFELSSNPNKFIPIDFFENGERRTDKAITLKKILKEVYDENDVKKIIGIIGLFRMVDAIDLNVCRVGSESEKELKMKVINNDRDYELFAIEKSIETLSKLYCTTPTEKALFIQRFYEDFKKEILEGAVINFKTLETLCPDKTEFENYISHAYYASFISIQPTHFYLHSSVEDFKIEYSESEGKFKFTMVTPKSEEELKKMKVKERGREEMTVFDRLIGPKNCYILSELNSSKKFIGEFIKRAEIRLEDKQGKQIGKSVFFKG